MNKTVCKILFISVFVFINISFVSKALACKISDADAIAEVNDFCKKMGMFFQQKPWPMKVSSSSKYSDFETKEIVFGARGDYKGIAHVNCDNGKVIAFFNWEHEEMLRKKNKISSITTEPRNWPQFISKDKAKEKVLINAKKIGIPLDMEFSGLSIDNNNGFWGGEWIRKLNGYPYENDRISVEIMAIDGEFYSYSKTYHGKPCPTEVKVTKEEAIKEGLKQIDRLFNPVPLIFRRHEIKSAELKIIQPNTLAGQMVRQRSTESRLAWVLHYVLKDSYNLKGATLQSITIKIDAATKKFLGGSRSR